jgi:hypothetical protein
MQISGSRGEVSSLSQQYLKDTTSWSEMQIKTPEKGTYNLLRRLRKFKHQPPPPPPCPPKKKKKAEKTRGRVFA